jgi:heat-inducible transcriptional repressor
MMEELTERQKLILTLTIHEYIRSGLPISSQHLVEHYHLEMSTATVRNELALLTDEGFLRQPHTSAGRVPSEDGYRYFVGRLIRDNDLPETTRNTISHQFYQMRNDVEQWMRLAASVLAHQSSGASMVTAPHTEQAHFRHLELVSTRGRQVLMVLVMMGGELQQRLLTLSEPFSQEQLSTAASRITDRLQGKNTAEIELAMKTMSSQDNEIISWVLEEMRQANSLVAGDIFLDGITNVLAEPEFSGLDSRRALRVLEERPVLEDLLTRTIMTSGVGGVQVLIGGEGTWEDLSQCSIVLARYGTPGLASGTLGVLGPMRMPYSRTISTVRFISSLLTDLVTETLNV